MSADRVATFLVAFLCCSAWSQPDNRPPLQKYRGDAAFGVSICGMTFQLYQLKGGAPDEGGEASKPTDYLGCISENKANIMSAYQSALKTVPKPKAKAALKEHLVASLNALQGISPQSGELVISYKARQAANKARMDEQWTRFEIEN